MVTEGSRKTSWTAWSSSTPSAMGRWKALRPTMRPVPAGPLVDHGGADGLGQVVGTLGLAAGVDEPDAAGVAVDDLPAGQVDGVVGGELLVDERVGLAEVERRCSRRCSRAASA